MIFCCNKSNDKVFPALYSTRLTECVDKKEHMFERVTQLMHDDLWQSCVYTSAKIYWLLVTLVS